MGIFDSLSGILDSGNHDSILGAVGKPIQKWTDPLSLVTGGKWADWTSTDIPRASNQVLSKVMTPFDKVDETINPVRRWVPGVDEIGDVVRDKPASAIGTAVGSIFGGGALLGGLGAGGAGGAGAAGGTAGGGGGGLFGGILGGGAGGGGGGALGTGLASGGSAVGYGGGVSSSVLPGIFQGASVAPQGAAGVGSFSGGMGGLGAFGGGAGTGSITGAGSAGGLGLNSGGLDWMQLAQQGQRMMNQNQQQQQQQQGRMPIHGPPGCRGCWRATASPSGSRQCRKRR